MQWPISVLIWGREECLDLRALRSDRHPKIVLANYSLPSHLHLACIILVHSKHILMQVFPQAGNLLGGVWSLSEDSWASRQRIHILSTLLTGHTVLILMTSGKDKHFIGSLTSQFYKMSGARTRSLTPILFRSRTTCFHKEAAWTGQEVKPALQAEAGTCLHLVHQTLLDLLAQVTPFPEG